MEEEPQENRKGRAGRAESAGLSFSKIIGGGDQTNRNRPGNTTIDATTPHGWLPPVTLTFGVARTRPPRCKQIKEKGERG